MTNQCMQWEQDHFRSNFDIRQGPIFIEWFRGAKTNVSFNCLVSGVASLPPPPAEPRVTPM